MVHTTFPVIGPWRSYLHQRKLCRVPTRRRECRKALPHGPEKSTSPDTGGQESHGRVEIATSRPLTEMGGASSTLLHHYPPCDSRLRDTCTLPSSQPDAEVALPHLHSNHISVSNQLNHTSTSFIHSSVYVLGDESKFPEIDSTDPTEASDLQETQAL